MVLRDKSILLPSDVQIVLHEISSNNELHVEWN